MLTCGIRCPQLWGRNEMAETFLCRCLYAFWILKQMCKLIVQKLYFQTKFHFSLLWLFPDKLWICFPLSLFLCISPISARHDIFLCLLLEAYILKIMQMKPPFLCEFLCTGQSSLEMLAFLWGTSKSLLCTAHHIQQWPHHIAIHLSSADSNYLFRWHASPGLNAFPISISPNL